MEINDPKSRSIIELFDNSIAIILFYLIEKTQKKLNQKNNVEKLNFFNENLNEKIKLIIQLIDKILQTIPYEAGVSYLEIISEKEEKNAKKKLLLEKQLRESFPYLFNSNREKFAKFQGNNFDDFDDDLNKEIKKMNLIFPKKFSIENLIENFLNVRFDDQKNENLMEEVMEEMAMKIDLAKFALFEYEEKCFYLIGENNKKENCGESYSEKFNFFDKYFLPKCAEKIEMEKEKNFSEEYQKNYLQKIKKELKIFQKYFFDYPIEIEKCFSDCYLEILFLNSLTQFSSILGTPKTRQKISPIYSPKIENLNFNKNGIFTKTIKERCQKGDKNKIIFLYRFRLIQRVKSIFLLRKRLSEISIGEEITIGVVGVGSSGKSSISKFLGLEKTEGGFLDRHRTKFPIFQRIPVKFHDKNCSPKYIKVIDYPGSSDVGERGNVSLRALSLHSFLIILINQKSFRYEESISLLSHILFGNWNKNSFRVYVTFCDELFEGLFEGLKNDLNDENNSEEIDELILIEKFQIEFQNFVDDVQKKIFENTKREINLQGKIFPAFFKEDEIPSGIRFRRNLQKREIRLRSIDLANIKKMNHVKEWIENFYSLNFL